MIYSKGTHIESKNSNDDILPKSEGTGLPATNDLASEVRLLQEQLAALTATGIQGEGRGSYRDRGRGRGGARGRGSNTRTSNGCGKRGQIRRDCPNKKNADKDKDSATPAFGFLPVVVDSPTYFRDESIIMSSPPPVCPQSFQLLEWMWDYLHKEYVDPRTSPNVVEFQIDPLTRFKYYSIDPSPSPKKQLHLPRRARRPHRPLLHMKSFSTTLISPTTTVGRVTIVAYPLCHSSST
jgi:hypothetical protein